MKSFLHRKNINTSTQGGQLSEEAYAADYTKLRRRCSAKSTMAIESYQSFIYSLEKPPLPHSFSPSVALHFRYPRRQRPLLQLHQRL